VRFDAYDAQALLTVENGRLETVTRDGQTVYRWHINTGQTSHLRLNPQHPLYARLRYFDRFRFDFRIASGTVSEMGVRAMGHVSGPRHYKPHMWVAAIRPTEKLVWKSSDLELSRPD